MEPVLQRELPRLHESLRKIKALVAWEQLKRFEAQPRRIWAFQRHDPTGDEIKNEYTFFVAGLARIRSVLEDHSFHISQAVREGIRRQLAHYERQVHALDLHRRFGGPGG